MSLNQHTPRPNLDTKRPMVNGHGAKVVHAQMGETVSGREGYFVTVQYDSGMVTGYFVSPQGYASSWPSKEDVFNVPAEPSKLRVYRKKVQHGWIYHCGVYPTSGGMKRPADKAWEEIHSMEVEK